MQPKIKLRIFLFLLLCFTFLAVAVASGNTRDSIRPGQITAPANDEPGLAAAAYTTPFGFALRQAVIQKNGIFQ